jgi:hypothetical protein
MADEHIWVCTHCGAAHRDRDCLGDETCYDNAQLCFAESLQYREGRVCFARAVQPQGWEP